MLTLQPLQSLFKAYLCESTTDIAQHIQSTETMSNHRRLNIYHYGYRARLSDVLAADYEMLCLLLGRDTFDELARDYIDHWPSEHPSLRFFGQHFAHYLTTTTLGQQSPYLAELAALEWAFVEAFDAKDNPALTFDALLAIDAQSWPTASFQLHPSAMFVPLTWNVVECWAQLKADLPISTPALLTEPAGALVWRQDLKILYRSLSPVETAVFRQATQGATFGTLCETLLAWYSEEETVTQAAQIVTQWVQAGLIESIRL